jgi:monofunctional biosynthetic peptidoglycan transglycosylase
LILSFIEQYMLEKIKTKIFWKRFWYELRILIQVVFLFLTAVAIFYNWINPLFTPLMWIRFFDQVFDKNRTVVFQKDWVDIQDISKNVVYAVFAWEDQKFLDHFGFDFESLYNALEYNIKNQSISLWWSTISQQTAKNIFLRPWRSFVRKWLEVYFTLLIEAFWSKERILEVYLNIIEFWDGIYGIEAASQHYFKKSASKLTSSQAALLSAMLPNPRYYQDNLRDYRLLRRKNKILQNMSKIKRYKDSKEFIWSFGE